MHTDISPRLSTADGPNAKRRKVSRACDRCKSRKRRCDGDQPCALCTASRAQCMYDLPYTRGRPVQPGRKHSSLSGTGLTSPILHGPQTAVPLTNGHPGQWAERPMANHLLDAVVGEESIPNGASRSSRAASPNGEGITQPGHYLGPTSTFSFLRRAGRRFGRVVAVSNDNDDNNTEVSIFASGDIKTPEESIVAVDLPDRHIVDGLVQRYFDFAVPSHRFFHQPTVNTWVDSMGNDGTYGDAKLRPVHRAIVFLIMATALLYKVDGHGISTGSVDSIVGVGAEKMRERYFSAAQSILESERGTARLESVQARIASVLFLLNTSRLNQAWYMLGTTHQLIIALGLHRSRSLTGSTQDCILQECRKRCYWVAYTVDTYFSVMLGRPPLMSDHGVDQKYPALANDENITAETLNNGPVIRDCVQAAPIFHAKLARIIRKASNEQYLAHHWSIHKQVETAQALNEEIDSWQRELPVFLGGGVHPSSLVPIFRRQLRVVQMATAHATMIVNRPLILTRPPDPETVRFYVDKCLSAAHKVLEMVLELVEQNHLFSAFWNFQYITFHALSVVYVWIFQRRRDRLGIACSDYDENRLCELAEKVHAHLAEATQKNAPNLRYSIILEELKQETLRALKKRSFQPPAAMPEVSTKDIQGNEYILGQEMQPESASEWESMLDFPTDPELWLQLDSFPFESEHFLNV